MKSKLTVLLTNDDGYNAPGLKCLYDNLKNKFNVITAAPDKERSGAGHSFTYAKPLHYEKNSDINGINGYIIYGTPADCVKFAVSYLLPQRPDIVVSGINFGENSGLSAFYSGTVAGAREGAFWNIPSFSFSICKESTEYCLEYASLVPDIIEKLLFTIKESDIKEENYYYNINFPPCKPSEVKGTRITWQSMAFFDDRYEKIEVETHHTGEGYMIVGDKKDIEKSDAFDSCALMNNYITITPLTFDATAHNAIPHLRWLEDEDFLKR